MTIYLIGGILLILLGLFLVPIRGRRYEKPVLERLVDERDTMFSRKEIKPGEQRFEEYYKNKPGNLEKDNKFRTKPGLLSDESAYYNDLAFASAKGSFEAVGALFPLRKEDKRQKAKDKRDSPEELTRFLKEWGRKIGAVDVGIAELKDWHFYTVAGRKERYGKPVENNHQYGIAFTVEMDHELTSTGPQAPIVMESAHQYLKSGMIATQVALTLRNLGYEATTHIDANYDLICPLVAKDAGLGEIGRMGILMTPRLGPRVRISVVSTNAPLIADKPVHDDCILDFCTRCSKCAVVCPSASIPEGERQYGKGGLRWKIDQDSCFNYWCQTGTDCGRCMAVCPYSHKDNRFHRFVRWGIGNNALFRIAAVRLDDLFYGKKPKPGKMPEWM